MFEEYSSDSDDECNPYDFQKCPYGYYKGCSGCCKRCLLERREKEWEEYSKDFTERMFREFFKEEFDFIFTKESKINKYKEYEFLEINYDKFMRLNKKEKLRKLNIGKVCPEEIKKKISSTHNKLLRFKSPSGDIIEEITTLRKFCEKYNLSRDGMSNVMKGKQKESKGWSIPFND